MNNIPNDANFGIKRRLGKAYGRVKLPNLPIHAFVKGNWQARVGEQQFVAVRHGRRRGQAATSATSLRNSSR